jgi:branched-subunit amino acid ABC-type transport system permease component
MAFAVVIVGGMGSIVGAVVAALLLAQVQGSHRFRPHCDVAAMQRQITKRNGIAVLPDARPGV